MYLDLLRAGNTTFVDGIHRGFPRFRSGRLDAVVAAVDNAQQNLTGPNLAAVITTMTTWRQKDPNEFNNRGGTHGVGYRLWMEAKQLLRNRWRQPLGFPDPIRPNDCPGSVLLNVYVPPSPDNMEICHAFAYRWAIAAGKIAEDPNQPAMGGNWGGAHIAPVLYPGFPHGAPVARAHGAMQLQPGDIVSMWTPAVPGAPAALGHSLIAETATRWFSANNAGTFGLGVDRSYADTAGHFGVFGGHQVGWVGGTNQWRRPDGVVVNVFYRRA